MCYFEAEPCELSRSTWQVSRKRRRCDGCGGFIEPGAQYERCFFVFDGEADTDSACFACAVVSAEFAAEHGSHPNYNWLADALWECVDGAEKADPDAKPWRDALAGMKRRGRAARVGGGA